MTAGKDFSLKKNLTPVREQDLCDQADKCSFSCSIRTKQSEYALLGDGKRNPFQGGMSAVYFFYVFNGDNSFGHINRKIKHSGKMMPLNISISKCG